VPFSKVGWLANLNVIASESRTLYSMVNETAGEVGIKIERYKLQFLHWLHPLSNGYTHRLYLPRCTMPLLHILQSSSAFAFLRSSNVKKPMQMTTTPSLPVIVCIDYTQFTLDKPVTLAFSPHVTACLGPDFGADISSRLEHEQTETWSQTNSPTQQSAWVITNNAIISASLLIIVASVSANGVDLSSIPSVGRSVCLCACLSVCLSGNCTAAKQPNGSRCRLGWWVESVEVERAVLGWIWGVPL